MLLIFISFQGSWITILAHFGGPWDHFGTILVIKWDTDALKGTLEGPRMDLGLFLMDFGSPFGHHSFSVIWIVKKYVWIVGMTFTDC